MSHEMTRRAALGAFGLGGIVALTPAGTSAEQSGAGATFHGVWTYRSFLNNPKIDTEFNDLEFARATITIQNAPFGVLVGKIRWDGDEGLALNGSLSYGNPSTARFQGRGDTSTTMGWIYNYLGFLVPAWPDGVDQRPAIVGSVIRTVPHGNSPAGVVASFIAVRRDEP